MVTFPYETMFVVMVFVGIVGIVLGFMRGVLNDSDTPSRGVWIWCIGGGITLSVISLFGVWLIRMN